MKDKLDDLLYMSLEKKTPSSDINRIISQKILMEDQMRKKEIKRSTFIIVAACVVVLSSITALAATNHFWSRSINAVLPEDEVQVQELEKNGYIKEIANEGEDNSVTVNGITIKPLNVICDGRHARISFSVAGYDFEKNGKLGFDASYSFEGGDVGSFGITGKLYPGYETILSESGKFITQAYDNGDPLEWEDEAHLFPVPRYLDEEGKLEYFISISTEKNMIGTTLHIEIDSVEKSVGKADTEVVAEGPWVFDIPMAGGADNRQFITNQRADAYGYTIDQIEVTPFSVKTYYSFDGEEVALDDMPIPIEIVLSDGSKWLITGGGVGSHEGNIVTYDCEFGKILNTNDIAEIIYQADPNCEGEEISVKLQN